MRPRAQQANLKLLERELEKRSMSAYDAAEFLGINVRNVRPYFVLLRSQVRVCRWINHGRGPWIPVWEFSDEEDVPKPNRLTGITRKVKQMTFGRMFK